jgi:hypothetical protein
MVETYNLFQRADEPDIFCVIPDHRPVPGFVRSPAWTLRSPIYTLLWHGNSRACRCTWNRAAALAHYRSLRAMLSANIGQRR